MSEDLQEVAPRQQRGISSPVRSAGRAALLLPLVLLGCSSLAQQQEDAPVAGPGQGADQLIINHLKTFKDFATYDTFEISDPRWVHSLKGWAWLTCVRFQDRGHMRSYALFIREGAIIDNRYAVESDGCGTQTYLPLDLKTGSTKPPDAVTLDPLH